MFFLLLRGIPHDIIFGYHGGWDFDRLLNLYYYLQAREVQEFRDMTNSVAIGAGSLFKGNILSQFLQKSEGAMQSIRRLRTGGEAEQETRVKSSQKDIGELKKLGDILMGGGFG